MPRVWSFITAELSGVLGAPTFPAVGVANTSVDPNHSGLATGHAGFWLAEDCCEIVGRRTDHLGGVFRDLANGNLCAWANRKRGTS